MLILTPPQPESHCSTPINPHPDSHTREPSAAKTSARLVAVWLYGAALIDVEPAPPAPSELEIIQALQRH
jgi:hypothetical protein